MVFVMYKDFLIVFAIYRGFFTKEKILYRVEANVRALKVISKEALLETKDNRKLQRL